MLLIQFQHAKIESIRILVIIFIMHNYSDFEIPSTIIFVVAAFSQQIYMLRLGRWNRTGIEP